MKDTLSSRNLYLKKFLCHIYFILLEVKVWVLSITFPPWKSNNWKKDAGQHIVLDEKFNYWAISWRILEWVSSLAELIHTRRSENGRMQNRSEPFVKTENSLIWQAQSFLMEKRLWISSGNNCLDSSSRIVSTKESLKSPDLSSLEMPCPGRVLWSLVWRWAFVMGIWSSAGLSA